MRLIALISFIFMGWAGYSKTCTPKSPIIGYYSISCQEGDTSIQIEGKRPGQGGFADIRSLQFHGETQQINRTQGCEQWANAGRVIGQDHYKTLRNECEINGIDVFVRVRLYPNAPQTVQVELDGSGFFDGVEFEGCQVVLDCL